MEKYQRILDQLRNKEIESFEVNKNEFMEFREVLVKDEQFKHFRGEAKQGGNVVYTFVDIPRT